MNGVDEYVNTSGLSDHGDQGLVENGRRKRNNKKENNLYEREEKDVNNRLNIMEEESKDKRTKKSNAKKYNSSKAIRNESLEQMIGFIRSPSTRDEWKNIREE